MSQPKRESIAAFWKAHKLWLGPLIVVALILLVAAIMVVIRGPLPLPHIKV